MKGLAEHPDPHVGFGSGLVLFELSSNLEQEPISDGLMYDYVRV